MNYGASCTMGFWTVLKDAVLVSCLHTLINPRLCQYNSLIIFRRPMGVGGPALGPDVDNKWHRSSASAGWGSLTGGIATLTPYLGDYA